MQLRKIAIFAQCLAACALAGCSHSSPHYIDDTTDVPVNALQNAHGWEMLVPANAEVLAVRVKKPSKTSEKEISYQRTLSNNPHLAADVIIKYPKNCEKELNYCARIFISMHEQEKGDAVAHFLQTFQAEIQQYKAQKIGAKDFKLETKRRSENEWTHVSASFVNTATQHQWNDTYYLTNTPVGLFEMRAWEVEKKGQRWEKSATRGYAALVEKIWNSIKISKPSSVK
jgi:hypothetical protein